MQVDQPEPIPNLRSSDLASTQLRRLAFINQMDRSFLDTAGNDAQIEAAIRNLETAYRMQSSVPETCDLSDETEKTKQMYGIDSQDKQKAAYARQCLLARRFVERGVRFIELSCLTEQIGAGGAANPWDQHGDLEKGHAAMAHQVDQPMAALI